VTKNVVYWRIRHGPHGRHHTFPLPGYGSECNTMVGLMVSRETNHWRISYFLSLPTVHSF